MISTFIFQMGECAVAVGAEESAGFLESCYSGVTGRIFHSSVREGPPWQGGTPKICSSF